MKLIQLKDMNGLKILINPDHIVYVEDTSRFPETVSKINLGGSMVYVPYHAETIYEKIREETDPNYISYEHSFKNPNRDSRRFPFARRGVSLEAVRGVCIYIYIYIYLCIYYICVCMYV